jgi:hypothetical protein
VAARHGGDHGKDVSMGVEDDVMVPVLKCSVSARWGSRVLKGLARGSEQGHS